MNVCYITETLLSRKGTAVQKTGLYCRPRYNNYPKMKFLSSLFNNQKIMKKIFLALLGFAVISAQAQTADEIIQKHTAAMGGLDAFNAVTSVKITGIVTAQGMDLPITTQIINGKAIRIDVEVMGQSITNVYYNGTGWKINPFAGAETATEVTGTELIDFKGQASIVSNLMDYKNRGHLVELLAPEEMDGITVQKLKLTSKEDGRITTYYINAATYLVHKSVTKREMQGQEVDIETYYSDYKEFGGIKFAMSRSQKAEGQVIQEMNIEKVELNAAIDESIFKM